MYYIAADVRMRKHAHLIPKCQINLFWWRVIMYFGISVHWNGKSNWAVNWHADIFAAFTWNKHINMFNHDLYIACVQNMNIWTNIWLICILFPKTRNVIQKNKAYWNGYGSDIKLLHICLIKISLCQNIFKCIYSQSIKVLT